MIIPATVVGRNMATIAEFRLPASDTIFAGVFDAIPSLHCEMEQVIATTNPNFWLSGANRERIEEVLDAEPAVDSHSIVRADDDRWLYSVEFCDPFDVLSILVEEGGSVLNAKAIEGRWTVRARFPDRSDAKRTYDRLRDADIEANVTRLSELSEKTASELGLTDEQYETLVAAVEHGYFEIPRESSMQDLADELDVSHQALSERLRRAYETLVTAELDVDADSEFPSTRADG